MSTIASQLETLAEIKNNIKAAIIDKGQTVGDDFSTYANAIENISGGGDMPPLWGKSVHINDIFSGSFGLHGIQAEIESNV